MQSTSVRIDASTHEELKRLAPGSVGGLLRDRARGIDRRRLELTTERISISVENTFERDLTDRGALHAELRRMAQRVADHLRRYSRSTPDRLDCIPREHRR